MDIFNLSVDDLEKEDSKKGNYANEFKPNPSEAKDKVYRAKIRPVYWLDNPRVNHIPKTTFFFGKDDGNDTTNPFFDSAYSVGEECLAMNTFFDLKREGKKDARAEQLAAEIRPKSSYFYLVLVESDAVNSENEGKLMVYKAPIQVHKIIQGAINVSDEDKKIGIKPCNIFDPFKGKSLRLSINIAGGNWNYNGTVTWAESAPVYFDGEPLSVDKKDEFLEFLKEGNELMKPYVYQKMSDDRYKLLLSIISAKTGKSFGSIKPVSTSNIEIEGLDETETSDASEDFLNEVLEQAPKEEKKPVKKEEKKVEAKVEESSDLEDIDMDDLLDELDI